MALGTDLDSYRAAVNEDITVQTDPNSIPPETVGGFLVQMADIVEEYFPGGYTGFSNGASEPNPLAGEDKDIYFQDGTPVKVWQKQGATWLNVANIVIPLTFPDGNFTVRTYLKQGTATASSGFWYIDNGQYQKATQTQFTISAANGTLETQDLIYANKLNQILYTQGTPGLGQPALPANTVLIDVVIIPSTSSAADPYLLLGQTQEVVESSILTVSATADANGQVDLSAMSIPDFPIMSAYQNNNIIPASYDNSTKVAYGLEPSTSVTFKFFA